MSEDDVRLNVLVADDHPLHDVFCITVPRNAKFDDDLTSAIQAAYSQRMGMTLLCLELFKVDLLGQDIGQLELLDKRILTKHDEVANVWPSGVNRRLIHVYVQFAARTRSPPGQQQLNKNPLSGVRSAFDELVLTRQKTAMALRKATLSSASRPREHNGIQDRESTRVLNARPDKNTRSSIYIYHEAFRIFDQQTHGTDGISPSDYRDVEQLLWSAQDIYQDEAERFRRFGEPLGKFLGVDFTIEKLGNYEADWVAKTTVSSTGVDAFTAILELKNEIGTAHSDPTIQGAESFANYWTHEKMTDLRDICCCPSFIIALAGPWMCILGAVYTHRMVIQPLTDFLWLANHPYQEDRLVSLTRILCALRASLRHLDRYYTSLHPTADPHQTVLFPNIRQFQGPDGVQVGFDYLCYLVSESAGPIFRARTSEGMDIVVKFVQRYNAEAHQKLASLGLAPKLLFAGDESLGAGIRMIVMEYVPGDNLHTYLSGTTETAVIDSIRSDVEQALQVLHGDNIVFGDLRQPNVMVVGKEGGKTGGMLVDFDWCGQDGIGRYPASMNEEIAWPAGVERGGLMHVEHDVAMLESLFIL